MEKLQRYSLVSLRIAIGWYFFYAGITKVIDPTWSAAGFLSHAKMFPDFYALFLSPSILPIINFLNAWGITLVGVGFLLGLGMRISAYVGVMLMLLYYFPQDNPHGYIVDDHLINICALLLVASMSSSRAWSLYEWATNLHLVKKNHLVRSIIS